MGQILKYIYDIESGSSDELFGILGAKGWETSSRSINHIDYWYLKRYERWVEIVKISKRIDLRDLR